MTVDQLATEALALPADARAQLLDRIVESLGEISYRKLWVDEVRRRNEEVDSGRVQSIDGDEVLQRARQAVSE